MAEQENTYITPDQLVIGLYIHLDMGWMDHPFTFNQFKVRDASQIATLKSLGLKRIRVDLDRSDCQPGQPGSTTEQVSSPSAAETERLAAEQALRAAKLARQQKLQAQRDRISACEKVFASAAQTIKNINRNLHARPQVAAEEARTLVDTMVNSLLTDRDVAVHLMNDKIAGEEVYYHSLNVTVLSMILAKEMRLPAAEAAKMATGALFHDVGKVDIPDKILLKTDPLTKAETEFLKQHCTLGVEIARKLVLPPEAMAVILQHHENQDGTGYPKGLKADKIHALARIVNVANIYDNLCNPINVATALTPHEALQIMFSQRRTHFDGQVLSTFIRLMGVFPPGTVVRLSNDAFGLVMSVNPAKPLRPSVVIYDPDVPKTEAIILDLENEPEINISKAIRPAQLARPVFEYLSPRKRITYYFDSPQQGGA